MIYDWKECIKDISDSVTVTYLYVQFPDLNSQVFILERKKYQLTKRYSYDSVKLFRTTQLIYSWTKLFFIESGHEV